MESSTGTRILCISLSIYKRRSIRHFLQKPIPKEDMDQILEAGMWAPSEKNAQPWKFIVVRGAERKAMVKRLKEGIMKNRKGEEGGDSMALRHH